MDKTQKKKMKALAMELAKDLKTPEQLGSLTRDLLKITVEAALNAEMEHHLGYAPYAVDGRNSGNSRNGYTEKSLKGEHGEVRIATPRDRQGNFEPVLIGKGQTRIAGMDSRIRYLYATGLSTREIARAFEEMYGAEVSAGLISRVTDAVSEEIRQWQSRALEAVYTMVYFDCIVMNVREDGRVINKSVYLALGVGLDGRKVLLGMWIAKTEGARFWLSIVTELKNRGVREILIACVDGLKGFPEAIAAEFPRTRIQLCIVHMVRNTLRFISWKERKKVAASLRNIYNAATEQEALVALDRFAEEWEGRYPRISEPWRRNWENLNTIFDFPEEIRKVIYTTNAIESLNSVIRKSVRKRKVFPSDDSALKMVYLVTEQAAKRWTRPIDNWPQTLHRFTIEFEEQLAPYL
jgi:transposase-like protein